MEPVLVGIVLFFCQYYPTVSQSIGWQRLFEDQVEEFHKVPLQWENGGVNVPAWLQGRYIKNGPARMQFSGDQDRFYTNWADGWGKLHSFEFPGGSNQTVKLSGKFLTPPLYKKTEEAGKPVPSTVLSYLEPKDWSVEEKFIIESQLLAQTSYDNNNVFTWKLDEESYIATTDWPVVTYFDPDTLETIKTDQPRQMAIGQGTHWMREPGTENSLNFQIHIGIMGTTFHLYRWAPGCNYKTPEEITKFTPSIASVLHSFSVTTTHAIVFFYPIDASYINAWDRGFHPFEEMKWHEGMGTEIVIISLADGQITRLQADPVFSAHHVNAYNKVDGRILVDICTMPHNLLHDYFLMKNLLNHPVDKVNQTIEFTRYLLDPVTQEVTQKTDESPIEDFPEDFPRFNSFDYPTINERYRGKRYCWVYGWVSEDYTRHTIIKKNLCRNGGDLIFSNENHYYGEAYFVPNPEGTEEDDGILITVGFDGVLAKSYLLILNATDFTEIDRAYTDYVIPYSFHGMFFE